MGKGVIELQRLADRDFLTSVVLLGVYGLFAYAIYTATSTDVKDWIFPKLATYVLLIIAFAFLSKVLFEAILKRIPDIVEFTKDDQRAYLDVLVFFLIVLCYLFVMYGLGFWLSSFLMLILTSTYLTIEKTTRNIRLAVIVPFASCIVFYFVFLYFFYVPFPRATWWMGLMPD